MMTFLAGPHTAHAGRLPQQRWSLALCVGAGVFLLMVLLGSKLLNDPDTMWQVALGDWIITHRSVPVVDTFSFTMQGEPWISTQWLAQVIFALSFAWLGWAGPVLVSALAIGLAFALMVFYLRPWLQSRTIVIVAAVALALAAPHLLARPHVLALPIMVLWFGELVRAMNRRAPPPWWLLAVIALWANLHGGFVLGLALAALAALDVLWSAEPENRVRLFWRWGVFGVAALAMSGLTPYGWEAILGSRRILGLGEALALIGEWRPADFSKPGALEVVVVLAAGLVLWRGIKLPPVRIGFVLLFVFMALSRSRNAEVLALLAPLVLAAPLADRKTGSEKAASSNGFAITGIAMLALGCAVLFWMRHDFAPNSQMRPEAAMNYLRQQKLVRVLHDYNFGGAMIAQKMPPFIDGRTELYGEAFVVAHHQAVMLQNLETFFRLLKDHRIEATMLHPQTPAVKLLDRLEGWRRGFADDRAVVHVRDPQAAGAQQSTVRP